MMSLESHALFGTNCQNGWERSFLLTHDNPCYRYTLKHLLLRHMYNLPLPKLHATLVVAGMQLFSAVVIQ